MKINFTVPWPIVGFGAGFLVGWMVRAMLASFGIM